MNIIELNTCTYGSTGKIMRQISDIAINNGHKCWLAVPLGRHNTKKNNPYSNMLWIGNRISEDSHIILGRVLGLQGYGSILATFFFLRKLDKIGVDVLHIHNLHNSYINIPMLFKYVKKNNIRVIWTLHDCWAFTGHCAYFTFSKCNKWMTQCQKCPSYRNYPESFCDNSKEQYSMKMKAFCGVKDLMIVTPSKWLADLVSQSFLKDYPTYVINNGIDLSVFYPRKSNFRKENNVQEKMILGVAFEWGERKGLNYFVKLRDILPSEYTIVLVGTNDEIDQILPEGIISIHRTKNQNELAEIYSAADVFVNPTQEENYPTVNMEAIACGTPVVTFNTGGSPEMLSQYTGIVVNSYDVHDLKKAIEEVCSSEKYSSKCCCGEAKMFDNASRFEKYLELL